MPRKATKSVKPRRSPSYVAQQRAVMPPEVINAAVRGSITWAEVGLLTIIDSLCRDAKSGCFASNDYLAEAVGCSPDHASHMVSRLIKARLLVSETFTTASGNQRHLWPLWVRCNKDIDLGPLDDDEECRSAANRPRGSRDTSLGGSGCIPTGGSGCIPTPTYKGLETTKDAPAAADAAIGRVAGGGESSVDGGGDKAPPPEKTQRGTHRSITGNRPTPPSPDRERAVKLYSAALKHNHYPPTYKPDLTKWEREFARLRREVAAEELDRVLAWYVDHMSDKGVPQCYCAESFRKKFASLYPAIERAETWAKPAPAIGELTAEEKKLVERLSELPWPARTYKDLPAVVALTYRSYADFYRRCRLALKELDEDTDLAFWRYIERVRHDMGPPEEFVRDWLECLNEKNANWKAWSGVIKPLTLDSGQFQEEGAAHADEFGDRRLWGRLMKAIGHKPG